MQFFHIRALVALVTAPFALAIPALAKLEPRIVRHHAIRRPRLPADYADWSHVAGCESGGWQVLGGAFPDSLGISYTNFVAFGGRPLPPGPVSTADRIMQIRVADRLIASYHIAVPDEYGCGAW